MDLLHARRVPRFFFDWLHRGVGEGPVGMSIGQWRIDRQLENAERKLSRLQAQAALWRQINDIDKKLKMLSENKALYPVVEQH
jgi:hypothetical protein